MFSLKTHKELFVERRITAKRKRKHAGRSALAVGTLIVVTVLVALVSEIFVGVGAEGRRKPWE